MRSTLESNGSAAVGPVREAAAAPCLRTVQQDDPDARKIETIRTHFARIMEALGLDLNDDSLKDTPQRVAKMFVNELFSGLAERNAPAITTFENSYGYTEMLVEKDITLHSCCEHHFLPIIGKVHVGYFPGRKVVGLSKLNRLVGHYAKRPQVQERLTMQIAQGLQEALGTADVAVYIEADHLCVAARGVKDSRSATVTSYFGGRFRELEERQAFLAAIR